MQPGAEVAEGLQRQPAPRVRSEQESSEQQVLQRQVLQQVSHPKLSQYPALRARTPRPPVLRYRALRVPEGTLLQRGAG